MLRPVQTVRVTTREELDAALATADQITVDGDDELLSYAVNKAAGDPENQIAVKLEDRRTVWPSPPPSPRRVSKTAVAVAAAFAIIVIIAGLSWLLFSAPTNAPHPVIAAPPPIAAREATRAPGEATSVPEEATRVPAGEFSVPTKEVTRVPLEPQQTAPVRPPLVTTGAPPTPTPDTAPIPPPIAAPVSPPPAPPPEPSPTLTPRSDFWTNLPSLIWPLVAIVAIVALFLIARQAISTGRNVEITWKVTEKVSGRVVITKVRERSTKSHAAA